MDFFQSWLKNFSGEVLLACLLLLLLFLWWLSREISRWKNRSAELQNRINFLEGELDACRKSKILTSVNIDTGKNTAVGIAGTAIDVGVSGFFASTTKKDDLKIVEGIGPKIEKLFNNEGIFTFAELAETPVDRMKAILDAAGSRFQIHTPTTWADQAALARDGKWDELKKWQNELYKGKA